MALNIKDDEAQRLGRELAELTGESITTAVIVSLHERLERVRAGSEPPERRADRIVALGGQIAAALRSHDMTVEDLYDDQGLPA